MPVIWLNGTVGCGKTAVGRALVALLPDAHFLDGDDFAAQGAGLPAARWRAAVTALLRRVRRPGRAKVQVIAYPLTAADFARLRAACRQRLIVINLATPLPLVVRGRGPRRLTEADCRRARQMRSQAYHRRRFASATLPNAQHPPRRTALQIARL